MKDPITEKYVDKVTPEHRAAMQAIGMARILLGQHRDLYATLLQAERDTHSFGGMLDPTLYRDMLSSRGFAQQTRMITATLAFLKEIDAVANEVLPGAILNESEAA